MKAARSDVLTALGVIAVVGLTALVVVGVAWVIPTGNDEAIPTPTTTVTSVYVLTPMPAPTVTKTTTATATKTSVVRVTETRAARSTRRPISAPGNTVWDRLAQCESGGNWHINTGNGYYGGLQFTLSTWHAYGGTGYPHQNSRETQIAVAKRVQAGQGWGAWPACTLKLGIR